MRLLLKNGRVVDPASGTDETLDILIEGDRIADIQPRLEARNAEVMDVSRLVVCPGFIDMHVHLREPGQTHKETIASGGLAAARGGFTAVCCMPNTSPVNDCPEVTTLIRTEADRRSPVRVHPIGALTRNLAGVELADMAAQAAAGAVAFSDDGRCIQSARIMRGALERAKALGMLVIDHCEDHSLAEGGLLHEGAASARLGLKGIPAAAEDISVARDVILAEALETRVHIAHLSTRGAARIVREAKARGVRVTAEVTPHHLVLTDEALTSPDPRFKMNPPLRGAEDADALLAAVQDGTIDVFATDHAPHAAGEKAAGFEKAPFGIVGLETAVSLLLDFLVHRRGLPLARFVAMWSAEPARVLGLAGRGRLAPGAGADLTLLNLHQDVVVDVATFASLGRNSPFQGWKLKGGPAVTIVAGRIVHPIREC